MATYKLNRYVFSVFKEYKEVRHYQYTKELTKGDLITSTINISKNRKFNKSIGVLYWLRLRQNNKWSKPITGLRKTQNSMVYYGDIPKIIYKTYIPQHLLIFRFKKEGTQLIVEVFKNYYPKTDKELDYYLNQ